MPTARLLNGEADGDHLPIPDPPPQTINVPRLKPLPLDLYSKPPSPDELVESMMEIDTYRLGRDPHDDHVHRDRRGRYLYWLMK